VEIAHLPDLWGYRRRRVNPSLYCRTNMPGNVHLAIIRGTPSSCAEISGKYQARSYDEPNGEPAHALVLGAISDFESSIFR
jgi:hypothetical protein